MQSLQELKVYINNQEKKKKHDDTVLLAKTIEGKGKYYQIFDI